MLSDRPGSRRRCAKNVLSIMLMLLVALVAGQDEYSQADLEAMTEVELEDICIKRGFQLVSDESDELTKQDYIEAAQRCLSIEQEMNELLTQYPELADELEEEIQRMEKENMDKQAHLEELENQISNDTANGDGKDPGVAFTRGTKLDGNKDGDSIGDAISDVVENDEMVMTEEAPIDEPVDNSVSEKDEEPETPTIGDDTEEISDDAQTDDYIDDASKDETTDVGTDIESTKTSTNKEDLTLTTLAIESLRVLVKNAQDDVKRIINLAIPVLQPLFNVGDAAWQQMKSLFVRAREAYEAYQATSKPASESTEVAEACDVSA